MVVWRALQAACLPEQGLTLIQHTPETCPGAQVGDLVDMHNYVGPGSPLPTESRAAVLGEFGGLGLRVEGHRFVPQEDFCYELQASPAALEVGGWAAGLDFRIQGPGWWAGAARGGAPLCAPGGLLLQAAGPPPLQRRE